MRYRMETFGDELVVRNVETDLKVGSVIRHFEGGWPDPAGGKLVGCSAYCNDGPMIALLDTRTISDPIGTATVAVANYEAHSGYPDFKPLGKAPDPCRTEWRLGILLADAVTVIARAWVEHQAGMLRAETKERFGELIAQLFEVWYPSRFGSFNAETRAIEPYFASGIDPRVSFGRAAQEYGMLELSLRFPDVDETTLREMLSWPLDLLSRTLDTCRPSR